ncbi:hypothetical protein PIB30_047704 [Stylosanthes scabra]|uniref:Uncharacterized protein n=1 Tax=Stylosanthes scabra TaxID=79078 RepID=A0ABU6SIC9_9FABA|nr:hypothetical protein [Stylosanthes scabra]
MTGAASPHKDHARGTGQSRKAIRGSIFHLRARGPGDNRIVPVTAGYSWEPGAESRTPSNTCSKCDLNPELWNDPSPILGILVAPCDTSFKTSRRRPQGIRGFLNYNDESPSPERARHVFGLVAGEAEYLFVFD